MKYCMKCWIWIYLLSSIDPVFAFLDNNYKVTTDHTTFIPYVVSLILLEKEVKKPLLPNWPIKKVWKRVITHMALLPWTKPHGAFQFCFYRKNFFFLSAFSIVRGYNLLAPVQTCCVALQLWPASFILFTNSN